MTNNKSRIKFKHLCQEYGLTQIISYPTHFSETLQSTIDLIITNNSNAVLTSSPKGNHRSPENKQVFSNNSQVN